MSRKQLSIRITVSTIIFCIIILILSSFVIYADALISNYLAVGQLENDDTAWIFMQMYNNMGRPTISILTFALSISYVIYMIFTVIKYYKYKNSF